MLAYLLVLIAVAYRLILPSLHPTWWHFTPLAASLLFFGAKQPRARMWIPYAVMPIGLALLSLQYVAEIFKLVTGRELPFGLPPKEVA